MAQAISAQATDRLVGGSKALTFRVGMALVVGHGGQAGKAVVLVVVRRGQELIHIYDRDLALQVVLPAGRCVAGGPIEDSLPHLAGNAAEVGARAVVLISALGQPTLVKGLAKLRAGGHRVPAQLERSLRALDAAASLLRHPGTAQELDG